MKFCPHPYQLKAIKWLVQHPEAALLIDLGMGKTVITLAAIQQLRRTGAIGKTLVVAPLRVCYQVWSDIGEIGKWENFKDYFKVALLHGKDKEAALEEDADLYVTNHDSLDWLCRPRDPAHGHGVRNPSRMDELLARGVNCLVLDELSKFKHTNTRRFKLLKPYLGQFRRRWGLTGSPAANGLLDLFGQAYVLDLGKALGPYITHYRFKYFVPSKFVNGGVVAEWKPAPGSEARIYEALKPLAISMRATDHLEGMPDLVEQDVWVDLPDKARKFYDEFEREMIAELDGETVVAGSAGVVSNKCRQIASGGIYNRPNSLQVQLADAGAKAGLDPVALVHHIHDGKTDALSELIDELQGQPVLVGYWFKHDRARIEAAVKGARFIDGSTSVKEAQEIIALWNSGALSVLCMFPQEGLNLQGSNCAHFIWYTLPWELDKEMQTVGRIWRQGNKAKTVFVHRILARGTVDTVVARALRTKERTQDALMVALKDYAKGRRR